jgi:cysteine synthase
VYPDCAVVAMEPRECATLYDNLRGQHRIEGIGDKMVTLIHNLLTTDYICLVHDDDCVMGLKAIQDGTEVLVRKLGVPAKAAESLVGLFGISGVGNILAAIKMAKYLDLGPRETVVTVATDGFDRYPSVLKELAHRQGRLGDGDIHDRQIERWAKNAFHGQDDEEILDVRGTAQKERLYKLKAQVWTKFGYTKAYLDSMKKMDFW